MAEDCVSPRRLRYASDTRAPPAPRAAAMDAQGSKRRGRGSAGGTGVYVATGAQWGLREAASRCRAKGGFHRDLGIASDGRPRFRCCPDSLPGSKPGSSRRLRAALRRYWSARRRRIQCGDRRPTGPPTLARLDPRSGPGRGGKEKGHRAFFYTIGPEFGPV